MVTESSAMRVLVRGGGAPEALLGRGSLTQRHEHDGRIDGLPHQLAERALVRATCGR
jgi:hypothetical protein